MTCDVNVDGRMVIGTFSKLCRRGKDGMSSDKNVWENTEDDKMVGKRNLTRTVNNSVNISTVCIQKKYQLKEEKWVLLFKLLWFTMKPYIKSKVVAS